MKDFQFKSMGFILLILFQILYGCSVSSTQLSESLQETLPPTPTQNDERLSTPTQALIPVLTSTPKQTSTSTASTEPTHTPTNPSLTSEQIQAWILRQMDNPVCDLPCWWGIIPGTTTWEDAKNKLLPYASEIKEVEIDGGLSTVVNFSSPPENVSEFALTLGFGVHQDVVSGIFVTGIERMITFQLPELMEKYGIPGQIWVDGYSGSANDSGPRDIALHVYYPDKNFIVHYSAPYGEVRGKNLYNCLKYGPIIEMWSPDQYQNHDDIKSELGSEPLLPVLPISEALGTSVEAFYEMYKNSTNDICFETPIELWQWGEVTPEP
jgi:hypothetical protein